MGKKKGAKSRGTKESVEELTTHTPLQAIILADSFTTEFRPITFDRPKALLPLVNVAMIDHTLYWLQSAGVKEVFVFCWNHADQVIQHLQDSDWFSQPNFSVTTFRSNNAAGAGDALRFIYEQDVVRNDFVLVSGDTVSNLPLEKVMAKHKERRKKDRNAILTMVVKKPKPDDNDEQFTRIDPDSKQLLCYNKRAENQDCFIDICSPDVLSMFADNFDYQDLRRHFLKGLLDDDAMGYKVYTHELRSCYYAARVDSLCSYDMVSKDIVQRMPHDDLQFRGDSSSSAKIGQFTVIGSGTTVGNDSEISNSVVGKGCKIGANVSIDGSYIWNNVTIEDGCVLKNAIVCDGVIIKSEAVLETGVVLSFKVVVGQGFVVPAQSKVSLYHQPIKEEDSDHEELEHAVSDSTTDQAASEVGHGGMGFIWLTNDEGTSDDDDNDDDEEEDEDEDDDDDDILNENFEDDEYDETKQYFHGEVLATLERYESENQDNNNVILEVNSLRLSCNLITADCAGAVFYSIMKLALARDHTSLTELSSNAKSLVTKWKQVLTKYLPTMDEEIEVIMKFEELFESEEEYSDEQLICSILDHLYDEGIIQEEAVLKWASEQEGADESEKVFLRKAETFINWLKEAEEE